MSAEDLFEFDPADYIANDSDGSYRREFLRCFKLERWDGAAVDGKIEELRAASSDDPIVVEALELATAVPEWRRLEQFLPTGPGAHAEYAFRLLMSYDYFQVFMPYLGCVVGGVGDETEKAARAKALLEKLST